MSGESPLMVCTSETGMRAMASEFKICPPIWKAVKGKVAMMMSLFGLLMPFLRTGTALRTVAFRFASQERKMHQSETRKNCMTVRVIGWGRAVRMALEDVLVRIDAENQAPHSILEVHQHYDKGARRMIYARQACKTQAPSTSLQFLGHSR